MFSIVAGSYEKILYGLRPDFTGDPHQPKLKPFFIFPAHTSCIKALAGSPGGKWLASGSADEIIKIWDLRRRKEVGGLVQHDGSITYLAFPTRSHLVSASEDGTICLFHARDWAVLRILKGHKGRVNCVAIHPTSKAALSVGKDRTIRMWDLMRGKGSASTKLGKEGEVIRWSRSGQLFAVTSHSTLDIFKTDMSIVSSFTHTSRLHDVRFAPRPDGAGELMLVAAEDKCVLVYALGDAESNHASSSPLLVAKLIGHANRVKSLDVHVEEASPRRVFVVTVSSDGFVRLFDLSDAPSTLAEGAEPASIECISSYDTKGTRLTCVAFADAGDSADNALGKRKRLQADTGEQDEDEESDGVEQDEPNESGEESDSSR
ncbi:WD40 repeat-like protein [Exidia glandulosa HHB12029]|uniref:WD40 repeat-like protein n=1 Tax=Exidia glandulosa HHB12029 TaxID=1314781 RepID=A0A165F1U0_EXIGL|nr:WD40 repeat-like protein [Exidia glandulosa HHB12029]